MDSPHQPPHYSHSSKSQTRSCPRQYYYRKIRKLPEANRAPLVIGHIVDHVTGAIHQGIINDDPVSNPETLASIMMQTEFSLADNLPVEEKLEVQKFMDGALQERAFTQYRMMIDFQPVSVQREIRLWLNGMEPPILGFIDLVATRDNRPLLIDIKTAGRKPSNANNYRDQMAVYAAWYLKHYNVFPATEVLCLVKTKHPYWMRLEVPLTWQDVRVALEDFWQHDDRIKSQRFPANRNSMFCTEKLCSYWDVCHEEMDADQEDVEKLLRYSE